jgi:hypothetical protein
MNASPNFETASYAMQSYKLYSSILPSCPKQLSQFYEISWAADEGVSLGCQPLLPIAYSVGALVPVSEILYSDSFNSGCDWSVGPDFEASPL